MATLTDCTMSISRRYLSTEEEVQVTLSATYQLSPGDSSLIPMIDRELPRLSQALNVAAHRVLNDDFAELSDEGDAEPEPGMLTGVNHGLDLPQAGDQPDISAGQELSVEHERKEEEVEQNVETPDPMPESLEADHCTSALPSATPDTSLPSRVKDEPTINRPRQIVLKAELKRAGIGEDDVTVLLVDLFRKTSLAALTRTQADELLQRLKDGSSHSLTKVRAASEVNDGD